MSVSLLGSKLEYVNRFSQRFLERSILLNLFTVCEMDEVQPIDSHLSNTSSAKISPRTPGDIIKIGDAIGYVDEDGSTVKYLADYGSPVYHAMDHFELKKGAIANADKNYLTTMGIFLLNLHVLAHPLGEVIPYVNTLWSTSKIEKLCATALASGKITVQQGKAFVNGGYFIGHLAEVFVPGVTERGLTTSKEVNKVKARLLKQYAGQLNDPVIASKIDAALIEIDKAFLEGDRSKLFFDGLGKKAYGIQRKRMYLTGGVFDAFEAGTGKYDFVANSLVDGWSVDDLVTRFNEIRRGSYNRGVETRDGGAQTKFIMRVFNALSIKEDDCGSMHGIDVDFGRFSPNDYIGRTAILNGERVLITEDNLDRFTNRTIQVLSPMTCQSKHGLCYVCSGAFFKKLKVKVVATLAAEISSAFLSYSMANMHGTITEITEFDFEDYFM